MIATSCQTVNASSAYAPAATATMAILARLHLTM
jgi:hypothetical protein